MWYVKVVIQGHSEYWYFGQFLRRDKAEECLLTLAQRENVLEAITCYGVIPSEEEGEGEKSDGRET